MGTRAAFRSCFPPGQAECPSCLCSGSFLMKSAGQLLCAVGTMAFLIFAYAGAGTCRSTYSCCPSHQAALQQCFSHCSSHSGPARPQGTSTQSPAGIHLKAFLLGASRLPPPIALARRPEHRATETRPRKSKRKIIPQPEEGASHPLP